MTTDELLYKAIEQAAEHNVQRLVQLQADLNKTNDRVDKLYPLIGLHPGIKADVARLYAENKANKIASLESLQRAHSRMDKHNQFFLKQINDVTASIGRSATRVETTLGAKLETVAATNGSKLETLSVLLNTLKSDYDQKLSAINAVWKYSGILFLLLNGAGGFVANSYIKEYQNRMTTIETSLADQQKDLVRARETIKELQQELVQSQRK